MHSGPLPSHLRLSQVWFFAKDYSKVMLCSGPVRLQIVASLIWVGEVSLARTRERGAPRGFAARSRVLARLASLAQIGELVCRLFKLRRQ